MIAAMSFPNATMATRGSARKRVEKKLDPDFVSDFVVHRGGKFSEGGKTATSGNVKKPNLLTSLMKKPARAAARNSVLSEPAAKKQKTSSGGNHRIYCCSECIQDDREVEAYDNQEEIVRCAGNCGYAAHQKCMPINGRQVKDEWFCGRCKSQLESKVTEEKPKKKLGPKKENQCGECEDSGIQENLLKCAAGCGYACHEKSCMSADGTWINAEWFCGSCKSLCQVEPKNGRRRSPQTDGILGKVLKRKARLNHPVLAKSDSEKRKMISNRKGKASASSEERSLDGDLESGAESDWFPGIPELMSTIIPESPLGSEERDSDEDKELRQDLATWTIEQCASYFQDSYPELADLIRNHSLMGSSLVLLSRHQFLTIFDLPLGTALKMHAAVCQCRRKFF